MERYFIIVPCYNEEEVLPVTSERLGDCLEQLIGSGFASPDSRVLFVNDGSTDRTWELIEGYCAGGGRFAGLSLDRNRGHQTALTEGLTSGLSLSTRETVLTETPHSLAISLIVIPHTPRATLRERSR